jgi:hypothetical protein
VLQWVGLHAQNHKDTILDSTVYTNKGKGGGEGPTMYWSLEEKKYFVTLTSYIDLCNCFPKRDNRFWSRSNNVKCWRRCRKCPQLNMDVCLMNLFSSPLVSLRTLGIRLACHVDPPFPTMYCTSDLKRKNISSLWPPIWTCATQLQFQNMIRQSIAFLKETTCFEVDPTTWDVGGVVGSVGSVHN